jgi:glycosyltransferase 2 family protein
MIAAPPEVLSGRTARSIYDSRQWQVRSPPTTLEGVTVVSESLPHARAAQPVNARPRPSRRKVWIAAALGIPASAVFLFLAIRGADLGAVWRTVQHVQPAPLLGAVVCMGCVYWLQAARWRKIAHTGASQMRFVEMVVAGVAVNNVLPGRIGDLLRARWVSRGAFSYGRGIATVVFDRGFDLVVLLTFLLATLPLVTDEAWVDRIVVGAVIAVALLGLGIVAARAYTRRRPGGRRHRNLVRRFARDVLDGLSEPLGMTRTQELVLLSLAAWLTWALGAYLVARSVGIELTILQAIFVTAALNLGVAIPSSPGFVGTYQWLGVSALALFGVPQNSALAYAIVLQAVWYVPTTLVGLGLLLSGTTRRWGRRAPIASPVPEVGV